MQPVPAVWAEALVWLVARWARFAASGIVYRPDRFCRAKERQRQRHVHFFARAVQQPRHDVESVASAGAIPVASTSLRLAGCGSARQSRPASIKVMQRTFNPLNRERYPGGPPIHFTASWCNRSMSGFDPVGPGANPGEAANIDKSSVDRLGGIAIRDSEHSYQGHPSRKAWEAQSPHVWPTPRNRGARTGPGDHFQTGIDRLTMR